MRKIEFLGNIMVRKIPTNAHKNFKMLCAAEGMTMQQAIRNLMMQAIVNKSIPCLDPEVHEKAKRLRR